MAVVRILAQVVFVYKQILHHLRQELYGKRFTCLTPKAAEVQCIGVLWGGIVIALVAIGHGAIQIYQHEAGALDKGSLATDGAAI